MFYLLKYSLLKVFKYYFNNQSFLENYEKIEPGNKNLFLLETHILVL